MSDDLISRQEAIDFICSMEMCDEISAEAYRKLTNYLDELPSAETERYTKEELRVFQHGISLSLLSKRSAQHWQYDEDRAAEIKFLERLYEKVGADMRGESDELV